MQALTAALLLMCQTKVIATDEKQQTTPFSCENFQPSRNYEITELKGGLSGISSLYKITIDGQNFVLRLNGSPSLTERDDLELSLLFDSSKKGHSPRIYAVSKDKRAVLMEFVDGKTLTLEEAKRPENIAIIGKALRNIHSIQPGPIPGETLLSKANRCFPIVSRKEWAPQGQAEKAFRLVNLYSSELSLYHYEKVRSHGDLNPRNIFITSGRVLFIDWAESGMEDPFYDLAFFSLRLNFTATEERFLLETYLERALTQEELRRFQLNKKLHQAFWCLTNLYLADVELKKNPQETIDPKTPLKSWGGYMQAFAGNQKLGAQYFYDLSRLNLQMARE